MWPQIFELVPHFLRLVPALDRFLPANAGDSEAQQRALAANRQALEEVAERLRQDLGQVTASHEGLFRQMNAQNDRLADMTSQLNAARRAVEASDARVEKLEKQAKVLAFLISLVIILNLGVLAIELHR